MGEGPARFGVGCLHLPDQFGQRCGEPNHGIIRRRSQQRSYIAQPRQLASTEGKHRGWWGTSRVVNRLQLALCWVPNVSVRRPQHARDKRSRDGELLVGGLKESVGLFGRKARRERLMKA